MIAGAIPPAAHIVTSPRFKSRRSSSSSRVPIRIEPVAPPLAACYFTTTVVPTGTRL